MLKTKNLNYSLMVVTLNAKSELETKYAWYQLKTHPNAI